MGNIHTKAFLYSKNYSNILNNLVTLTQEKWSFGNRTDNSILNNYLHHTFNKLYSENKVIITNDYYLFNTGLFTEFYSAIYALGKKVDGIQGRKWELDNFYDEYSLGKVRINGKSIAERPQRANYFDKPELLVFDANCDIYVQYDHILKDEDNKNRLPLSVRNDPMLLDRFTGAVNTMKKRVTANYKLAVPQYYDNDIQLLLPLSFLDREKVDVALVVSKNDNDTSYQGKTCLTVEMAYNNARLIAKPDSNWLTP